MHLAFIETRSQAGISAPPVTVEVHLSAGLPAFQVVGVTDAASREIRSRVRSAIVSSHLKWPDFNITINLSPTEQIK
jgi:magnesium chelatase family protein